MRNPFRPEASRKYIDLIRDASTNWANWDPSLKLEPGDFGVVDSKTGKFEKHDSIYTNEQTAAIAKPYRPLRGEKKTYRQVVSENVRSSDFHINPQVDLAGIAEASVKTQWEFETSRGAVLIMHEPRTLYVPGELLQNLARSGVDCLRGKSLITEVLSCPSYAMYLSAGSKECVKIALVASVPAIPPGISAGGGVGMGWWSSRHNGIFEHAHSPIANFFPLYSMKTLKDKLRRRGASPVDASEETFFGEVNVPWGPLDEDGNEVDDDPDEGEGGV